MAELPAVPEELDDPFLYTPFTNLQERCSNQLTDDEIALFRDRILAYYSASGRDFPWRNSTDPYHILLSEIMLQQTQAERVLPKYLAFIERWPGWVELASAPFPEVLGAWKGLGYNRRALALKEIALKVVQQYGGDLPAGEKELRTLPMVGPATAAAVMAFARQEPALYLETNIRRVLIYYFFDGAAEVHDRELYAVLEQVQERRDPRSWYYALMDYGVFLKGRINNPNRRSAHYNRQEQFADSDRQVRGQILTVLTEQGIVTGSELLNRLPFPEEQVLRCLSALVKERFLHAADEAAAETGPSYRISKL